MKDLTDRLDAGQTIAGLTPTILETDRGPLRVQIWAEEAWRWSLGAKPTRRPFALVGGRWRSPSLGSPLAQRMQAAFIARERVVCAHTRAMVGAAEI